MPDYKGKYFNTFGCYVVGEKTIALLNMDLYSLKQAFNENRLSGKLKELVATLNEDADNEVYMFANFK